MVLDSGYGQQGGAAIFNESLYISNCHSYCGSGNAALLPSYRRGTLLKSNGSGNFLDDSLNLFNVS